MPKSSRRKSKPAAPGTHQRPEDELKRALSLLTATLDSTADGILVVDQGGRIASHNRRFAEMWRIPEDILASHDDDRAIASVLEQLADPQGFLRKVRELYDHPEAESFDVLRFKDGRVFERSSLPRRVGDRVVGRVWSFRDVTERKRAEQIQVATFRISEAAHTAPNLQELYRAIHEIVGGLMPAKNFYIALYDQATEAISFPYFVDEYDKPFPPKHAGKGLTEYVLRTGQPLLATQEVHRELEQRGEVELIGAPSLDWLGVPLRIGETTIGALVVQTYTAGVRYGETEKSILQFVSTQVAMAIERKRTEEKLQETAAGYRLLFESNPEAMWVYDLETLRFLAVNGAAIARYGYTRDEFLAMTIKDIRPPTELQRLEELLRQRSAGPVTHTDLRHRKKDGTIIEVEASVDSIEFAGRKARLVLAKDVTQRKHLEAQLRHSQKMEAIGRLAGGVAHDFNNIMTAILGYSHLLLDELGPDDARRQDVEEIRMATERAVALTRQLLAFGRKQLLQPAVLDLNAEVASMDKMLRRLIGEDIELAAALEPALGRVRADPSQIEQVIVNLAVNARDAMPHGGRLTLETANVELAEPYAREGAVVPAGPYVMLAVSDTGVGMDAETRSHLFEPFFTTKEVGKGTGLGLATVYGIVKQSRGYIWAYSEPGHGATFKIYLPRVEEAADVALAPTAPITPATGSETVLLVEDEEPVRSLARKVLDNRGYTVLEARRGDEALSLAGARSGPVHLLVTDVIMPGMSGRELAQRLVAQRPNLKVLYISGYTDKALVSQGTLDRGTVLLQKPFTPEALARKVREVLDAS